MWQISKEKSIEFLLSLQLITDDNLTNKEILKKLYTISNHVESHYKVFKISKRNGKYRTIYEPDYTLKNIQRNILKNVLSERKISPFSTAYQKSISLKENANPHLNKKKILKLDIKDFFPNIDFIKVYTKAFQDNIYPNSIATILTNLVTYNNFLPQGATTSSYISNLVLRSFDYEIGNYCLKNNISYTRYCDDMTFSGDFDHKIMINIVKKALKKEGLSLNYQKIHIIYQNKAQVVTGLVVNKKIQTAKSYCQKIRQEMYYIKKFGIDDHLKYIKCDDTPIDYLNSLLGKVLYVLQIDNKNQEFINYKNDLKIIKNKYLN